MGVLAAVWDDLFEDPQLRDTQAVTALRRGLVAALRQDPQAPWRSGAITTAWASVWPRLREGRSIGWQERFLDSVEEWFDACEREARHRIDGYIPSVADYVPLRKSTFGTDPPRPASVHRELRGGEMLDFGGGAEVLAVPGHTQGSLALHLPRHRVLFIGDTLANVRGVTMPGVFNLDSTAVDEAAHRLTDLDVDVVCVGHGDVLTAEPLRAWRTRRSAH
jgi:hypothetical protein